MRKSIAGCCGGLAMAVLAAVPCQTASAGEEATVKAFSAWQGQGRTFRTGVGEATFVGALLGRIYVETEKGPIDSGLISCPAVVDIGLEDASQRAQGRCTITAKDGAQIYAELTCTGVYLVGCTGDIKLTGGTQRFAGITGGGKATIRTDVRQITVRLDGVEKEEGTGILYLQELHYKLP